LQSPSTDEIQTSTPTLTGNAIAVSQPTSGPGKNQIDVFLSPDLKKTLQDTIDNECKVVDKTQCALYLYADIQNARVDSTSNLQGRDLASSNYLPVDVAAGWMWTWNEKGVEWNTIDGHIQFDSDNLLKSPEPATAVVKAGALTVTLAPARTTTTGSPIAENYVIIPKFSPKVSDKVPDIVARQLERLLFETRAAVDKIVLKRVLIDEWVDFWTADLTPIQLAAIQCDALISYVFPNFQVRKDADLDVMVTTQRSRIGRGRRRANIMSGTTPSEQVRDDHSSLPEEAELAINYTRRATSTPGWSTQSNAPRELHALSNLVPVPVEVGDYEYISSAGSDSIIYILETDPFVLSHTEIGLSPADIDGWIYPKTEERNPKELYPQSLPNDQGHATHVST
jgi:hypothetical protein